MFVNFRDDIVVSKKRRKTVPHDSTIEEWFLKRFSHLIGHESFT